MFTKYCLSFNTKTDAMITGFIATAVKHKNIEIVTRAASKKVLKAVADIEKAFKVIDECGCARTIVQQVMDVQDAQQEW